MANKIELEYEFIENSDEVEEIENDSWEDQGKFQTRSSIIKYQDKFYTYSVERSGDHWRGYEWSYNFSDLRENTMIELIEVHKVSVTTEQWRIV